jgi:GNAT superfamily N-acetyltransferase
MNSSNVIELKPVVEEPAKAQVIVGLIPSQNQFILNAIAPVIMPGMKELAEQSMEEFTAYQLMTDILYGAKQLHMFYIDRAGTVEPENFQADFARRLQEPAKDFAGFTIIEPIRNSGFHIFAGWVAPEFRRANVAKVVFSYLEKEARKMGAPYISTATSRMFAAGVESVGLVETTVNFRKKLKE